MTWFSVAILFAVSFTSPARDAGSPEPPARCFCRDTTTAAAVCSDVTAFEVWRQRQAPTAVRLGSTLYSNPDSMRVNWPQVRIEAALDSVATFAAPGTMPGTRVTLTLPDSLTLGWWYYVRARDTSGNRACLSNGFWR